jgi:hypothetical protein
VLRESCGRPFQRYHLLMSDNEEPGQEALFQIEGPDEDGCVWICSAEGRDVWCQNLGPADKAASVMLDWLGAVHTKAGDRL